MFILKRDHILKLLENLPYFSLLGLGIYFIYMGDVIPRFWVGRTNFAEYEEEMDELPTISTFVYHENLTLGEDFNLSLSGKILKFGNNDIQSNQLKVHLQHVMPEQFFTTSGKRLRFVQITPLNFPPEIPFILDLEYFFVSTFKTWIGIYLTR